MGHLKKKVRKGSRSYSILQGKEKYCYVTGRTEGLDKHHIYHGPGWRDISDRHGFWVYLWQPLHLAGLGGLHKYPNTGLDLKLKQDCQRRFEEIRIEQSNLLDVEAAAAEARKEFMKIIGRNYLGEGYPYLYADNDGFYLLEEEEQ